MKQRRNKWGALAVVALMTLSVSGQSLEKLFVSMPVSVEPLLGGKERTEMVEYYKNGMIDTVQNRLGGAAFLLKYDTLQNSVLVRNTANSLFELKILNKGFDVPVIAVINTVLAPIANSDICFYDLNWRTVKSSFAKPVAVDWLDVELLEKAENVDIRWVKNSMPVNFVTLKFEDAGKTIVADNFSFKYLAESDAKIVSPFLKNKPIRFELENGVWVKK